MSNVIGEFIGGKYDIQAKLGQGGSGVVYLAKKLGTNERYAIKTISTEEENAIKLLERETETLKRLSKFDTKKYQNSCIEKIIKRPRKDNIEDIIDHYQDIEKLLQPPGYNIIELIQVNKIEKVYPEWHEVLLVLYKSNANDTELEYEIFSRDSIQKDYRETIEKLYGEGKKIHKNSK